MTNSYVAFGLKLRTSFQLPGMAPDGVEEASVDTADELPSLELKLTTPQELHETWSDAGGLPEWRGRLGDGLDLAIERGADGGVLFSYGEHAPCEDVGLAFCSTRTCGGCTAPPPSRASTGSAR